MNGRVYHIKFETDKEAQDFAFKLASQHVMCHVSFGFGNTEAVVVAYDVEPEVFGDVEYELVESEPEAL